MASVHCPPLTLDGPPYLDHLSPPCHQVEDSSKRRLQVPSNPLRRRSTPMMRRSSLGTSLAEPASLEAMTRAAVLVRQAQTRLVEFASATNKTDRDRAKEAMGQNEGLCTLLKLAALEPSGDVLDSEELAKYMAIGGELVSSYIDSFTAGGVVTALMLSVVLPFLWELEVPGDSAEGIGQNGAEVLSWAELISLNMVIVACCTGLFMSGVMYCHIKSKRVRCLHIFLLDTLVYRARPHERALCQRRVVPRRFYSHAALPLAPGASPTRPPISISFCRRCQR